MRINLHANDANEELNLILSAINNLVYRLNLDKTIYTLSKTLDKNIKVCYNAMLFNNLFFSTMMRRRENICTGIIGSPQSLPQIPAE